MSLTEVLQAVRALTPTELEKVRKLLEELDNGSRHERFEKLLGSAKDDKSESLTLEDFKKERREIWEGLAE